MLVSDPKGRDIKIDSYTLSFHGRLLIEGAEVSLNYGQRYGLLGENGSGKVSSAVCPVRGADTQMPSSRPSCNPSPSEILKSRTTSISTSSVVRQSPPTSTLSTTSSNRREKRLLSSSSGSRSSP